MTTLPELRAAGTRAAVLRVFDALPAVTLEEMTGSWRGSEVPTGHPLDGVLVASGWYGKRFESTEDVHPLVMSGPSGDHWYLNPARVPEFRGVVTATMCYDALPIHDAFRRIDATTLLGVMDVRGAPPYVFALERDGS